MKLKQIARKGLALVAAGVASVGAFAQSSTFTVDTSPITSAQSTLLTVGAAVFGVAVSIKLYKWARRAL